MLRASELDLHSNRFKPRVLTLGVELLGSNPRIWRRFVTRNDITLQQFHDVLQTVMGWRDEHFYEFILHSLRFGDPEQDDDDPLVLDKVLDATKVTLSQTVNSARDGFMYMYDSGDDWNHRISLVSILPLEETMTYPYCIRGEYACPPENVGGLPGYYSMLSDLNEKNAQSSHHLSWLDECGYRNFDSSLFDIEKVNKALAKLFRKLKS